MASSPQWVYKQAFGEWPDNAKVIHAQYEFGTDFIEIYLSFEINDVNSLLAHAAFNSIQKNDFLNQTSNRDTPSWFTPMEDSASEFYKASPFGDSFSSSRALLSYNNESSKAFFYYMTYD